MGGGRAAVTTTADNRDANRTSLLGIESSAGSFPRIQEATGERNIAHMIANDSATAFAKSAVHTIFRSVEVSPDNVAPAMLVEPRSLRLGRRVLRGRPRFAGSGRLYRESSTSSSESLMQARSDPRGRTSELPTTPSSLSSSLPSLSRRNFSIGVLIILFLHVSKKSRGFVRAQVLRGK